MLAYFSVSGGPFGLEVAVAAGGPARVLWALLLFSLLSALPSALMVAELSSAAVLVCVVDATALPTQAKEAAQVLYDVLTHDAVQRRSPALVIAANKCDERGAAKPQCHPAGRPGHIETPPLIWLRRLRTNNLARGRLIQSCARNAVEQQKRSLIRPPSLAARKTTRPSC